MVDIEPGQQASFTKTVTESDVSLFAAVSGDFHPQHVDEEYAKTTRYGQRLAHGALLVAYMSAAFARYWQTWLRGRATQPVVSYGYDRIRFIRPVFIGDTVTTDYRIAEVDVAADKVFADVTCTNQRGDLVAAARHIIKFV